MSTFSLTISRFAGRIACVLTTWTSRAQECTPLILWIEDCGFSHRRVPYNVSFDLSKTIENRSQRFVSGLVLCVWKNTIYRFSKHPLHVLSNARNLLIFKPVLETSRCSAELSRTCKICVRPSFGTKLVPEDAVPCFCRSVSCKLHPSTCWKRHIQTPCSCSETYYDKTLNSLFSLLCAAIPYGAFESSSIKPARSFIAASVRSLQ